MSIHRRSWRVSLLALLLVLGSAWRLSAQGTDALRVQPNQTPPPAERAPGDGDSRYRAGELVVKFEGISAPSASQPMLDEYGAQVLDTASKGDAQLWMVPEGQELSVAEDLGDDPRVQYAEPNYIYHAAVVPNDPSLGQQWAHTLIRSPAAWDVTTGSESLIIAIIDSGIDASHPDLRAKIVRGRDIVDGDGTPQDENGHGTHVAGIAAAATNNAIGIAGTDWQARIMPVRVLEADGSGTNWNIGEGIYWAYQHGAKVLNLSLSGPDYSQHMQDAIDSAKAAGRLVVAAMGNCRAYSPPECPVANPTSYPAAYENTLAVAATTRTDGYARYSQSGNHCDVSAPGGEIDFLGDPKGILGTLPTYNDFYLRTAYGYEKDYDYMEGTSMAAAHVSGLAALIWAAKPSLTAGQVQSVIEGSADDLGAPGPDRDFGHGRINALAALQSAASPKAPVLSPIERGSSGQLLLAWGSVAGTSSYTLQEDENWAFTSPTVRYTGAKTSYQIVGQDGGLWYYRVRATNAAGSSPWSNIQSVLVVPKATTLDPISNPDNEDEYEVRWAPSAGAEGYRLAESPSPTGPYATRYAGPGTRFRVTGQPAGTWHYVVYPYNSAGDGASSSRVSTTVDVAALPTPDLFAIDNADGDGNYAIEWTKVKDATSYALEESASVYFDQPTTVYSGSSRMHSVTGQPGGTWYYRVRALGPEGKSPWSTQQPASVTAHLYLPAVKRTLIQTANGASN